MGSYPEIDLVKCDMRGRIHGELVTAAAVILPASANADQEKLFVKKFKWMYKFMTMRGTKGSAENPDAGRIFIRISRNGFTPDE